MTSRAGEPMLPGIVKEALSRIKVLLDMLFEAADDAIFLMDGARFVDCNPGALRLFGCKAKEDILGQTPVRFSPDRQPDGTSSAEKARDLIAAATAGVPQQFEWRHARLDLAEFDVEVSLNRCFVGGAPFLVAVVRDITARKRAEAAVRKEKQFSDALIDSLPGIFYLYDSELRLRRWNKNHETQMGYTAEELQGKRISDWPATEADRERVRAAVDRLMQNGDEIEFQETELLHKDGSAVPYLLSGARIGSPGGAMLVGVGIDISARIRAEEARKRAELERERLMAELQAANSAKDQFMAVLSHELRTPLAAIQASVDLLLHLPTLDEPRTLSALRVIERNVRLQARLVNDLLDLSRLMRGKLTIERAPVRLGEVVVSAAETCRADAVRAEVSLETRAEPGLWVDADAARLQQMVINLVDNAIKFTPKGGRVTVSVTAKEHRGSVVVEDTGVGIAPERLSDIFEMFRQGEVAARRAPGLGIGLALVKSIIDLHGGRVWAESAGPGRGSRFVVELLLYEVPAAHTAHEVPASGRVILKILLVEDNTDTRTMLAETLAQLDYMVIPAASAEAALELLAREPVDVILADMGLPGMDGYDFLRQARRLPAAAHVPALALTGFGQESDARRAREAGYAEHFVKPATIELIDQQIRALVGSAQSEAQR